MTAVLALLETDGAHSLADVSAGLAAEVLGVSGMTVSVHANGSGPEVVWHSGQVAVRLADLQTDLGQGPSVDVGASGAAILQSDLSESGRERWPIFTPAAVELGVAALFTFPLAIGAIRLGVLAAYRRGPGSLTPAALADALAFADAAGLLLLRPADRADESALPAWLGAQPVTLRAQVHQATGMISVQLGVGVGEALMRLRAHAYAAGVTVDEVATDVVARRLRFAPEAQ
jgi:hypothetical protein